VSGYSERSGGITGTSPCFNITAFIFSTSGGLCAHRDREFKHRYGTVCVGGFKQESDADLPYADDFGFHDSPMTVLNLSSTLETDDKFLLVASNS